LNEKLSSGWRGCGASQNGFSGAKIHCLHAEETRLIIEEFCEGAVRFKDLADKPLLPFVKNALSWDDQQFVEKMAPERIQLPRGWRMKIHYDRTPRRAAGKDSGPIWAGGDADSGRGAAESLAGNPGPELCGRFSSPKTWRLLAESVPGAEESNCRAVSEHEWR